MPSRKRCSVDLPPSFGAKTTLRPGWKSRARWSNLPKPRIRHLRKITGHAPRGRGGPAARKGGRARATSRSSSAAAASCSFIARANWPRRVFSRAIASKSIAGCVRSSQTRCSASPASRSSSSFQERSSRGIHRSFEPDAQDGRTVVEGAPLLQDGVDDLLARGETLAAHGERAERVLLAASVLNRHEGVRADDAAQVPATVFFVPGPSFRDPRIPHLGSVDGVFHPALLMIVSQRAVGDVFPGDFVYGERGVAGLPRRQTRPFRGVRHDDIDGVGRQGRKTRERAVLQVGAVESEARDSDSDVHQRDRLKLLVPEDMDISRPHFILVRASRASMGRGSRVR